jgi:DNA-binding beta-propeller fold protein YncE
MGRRKTPQRSGHGVFGAAVGLTALLFALLLPMTAEAKRNVYVTNQDSNSVSAFGINHGALSLLSGSPYPAGLWPNGVVASPDGRHLYVADTSADDTISAFGIGSVGELTPLAGSPFHGNGMSWPMGVAVSPDGKYLFVANAGVPTVSAFNVAGSGSLSPVAGSPFFAELYPEGLAVSPDGKHLYVTNGPDNTLSAFKIAGDGSLAELAGSPYAAGAYPTGIAVTRDGKHLYVANHGASNISAYGISANGGLSPVAGSPFTAGRYPYGIALSPDGKHLYSTNGGSGNISAFNIAGNGGLAKVSGSPFGTPSNPSGVAVSPNSNYLYVSNSDSGLVTAYSIGANGSLGLILGSPFATGGSFPAFQSVAITPNQPPVASFAISPGPVKAGSPVSFDASASTDPDGVVSRYDWDFGDGGKLPNGGPTPTHTYAAGGSYDVTLTLTDNEGCSTKVIYTGQTTSCNGSAVATKTKNTDTIPPKTTITKEPKAKIKTSKQRAKVRVSFKSEKGAKFKCRLDRASYKSCSSPYKVKVKAKPGKGKKHTISIKAIDQAGNVGKPANVKFRVIREG